MKKLLLSALLMMSGALMASARGTTVTTTLGVFNVDTVFHAKIGPGTTQTQLRLTGPKSLDVFYVTVDQSTPGVSIRTVSGRDKVAGNATTSSMAKTHSHEGLHYFAGSNGDFYYTGGSATNGSSIVGTPINAFAADREMYRTSNQWYQFSVDIEGVARICRLNFQKGTATKGDQTVAFKAINNDAPNNGVTLYTSKFWGSSNQTSLADNCSEVTARLVEGDNFWAGCSYRLEVTSTASHTGDLTVPDNGFVILGRGNANDFVNTLQPGDIVTFDNVTLTSDGEKIVPSCIVSGNPKNVGGGVNLNSEGERGDASALHPRTGIGVSADGTKIVMMAVDGRSSRSAGITTGALGDLLIFAGCAEGVNLDGGGSTTLYCEPFGVINNFSDSSERPVSNGVFAVLEAPEDNTVAELGFYDYNPSMPYLGVFRPRVMAFNAHGLAIDTDFKDFTLTCPPEYGQIIDDGKALFITGRGCFALTAHYGDIEVSIPVTVEDATAAALVSPSVIVDAKHPYTIDLFSTIDGKDIELNPAALSWTSADPQVASVDDQGVITAHDNGTTTVTGSLGDIMLEQKVTTETWPQYYKPLFDMSDAATWRNTGSDINGLTVTPGAEGLSVDFSIKLVRGPKLTLRTPADLITYGLPEAIDINLNPGNTRFSSISVSVLPANSDKNISMVVYDIPAGAPQVQIPLADYLDYSHHIFPLQIKNIIFNFANEVGEECHFDITSVNQNYDTSNSVADIAVDADAAGVAVIGGVAYLTAPARKITLTDLAGRTIATGSGASIALPEGHGVVILTADGTSAKVSY